MLYRYLKVTKASLSLINVSDVCAASPFIQTNKNDWTKLIDGCHPIH